VRSTLQPRKLLSRKGDPEEKQKKKHLGEKRGKAGNVFGAKDMTVSRRGTKIDRKKEGNQSIRNLFGTRMRKVELEAVNKSCSVRKAQNGPNSTERKVKRCETG